MYVVNKKFELLEFVFNSVYVDLQYDEIFSLLLLGMCACVVVIGLSVRLSGTLCCECGGCVDCDACTVVC